MCNGSLSNMPLKLYCFGEIEAFPDIFFKRTKANCSEVESQWQLDPSAPMTLIP